MATFYNDSRQARFSLAFLWEGAIVQMLLCDECRYRAGSWFGFFGGMTALGRRGSRTDGGRGAFIATDRENSFFGWHRAWSLHFGEAGLHLCQLWLEKERVRLEAFFLTGGSFNGRTQSVRIIFFSIQERRIKQV